MYHYVYRITHIEDKRHYYGIRSCKVHPTRDLGIKYFSSSTDKEFIKDQKKNPNNFKYKIVKMFDNRKNALKYEVLLHNKFDVGVNESFYNKSKQTSEYFHFDCTGIPKSEEFKKKISSIQLGRPHTEDRKKNISKSLNEVQEDGLTKAQKRALKGENNPMYCMTKEKNPFYGKKHSEDTKKLLSEKAKGRVMLDEVKDKIRKSCSKPKKSKDNYVKNVYNLYFGNTLIFKETSSVRLSDYLKKNKCPSIYSLKNNDYVNNYRLEIICLKKV